MRAYLSLFLFIFLFIVPTASAEELTEILTGRVVAVHDGDTVTILLPDERNIKIRLAEIDAPEKAQPYGKKSKQALSGLIFNSYVTVVKTNTDRYGRTVGRIYEGEADVNKEMLRLGAAWAYKKYLRGCPR